MWYEPLFSAQIAKLMATLACHVVTAFISFEHHLASLTLPEVEVVHHVKRSILVAFSLVLGQHTQFAERDPANGTFEFGLWHFEDSFAFYSGTHPSALILWEIQKHCDFVVLLLLGNCEWLDVWWWEIQGLATSFLETIGYLKVGDRVIDVLAEAFLTILMATLPKLQYVVLIVEIKANLALLIL